MLLVSTLSVLAVEEGSALAEGVTRHVRLRDGSEVQGELVEEVPGQRLVLKLATGEVRAIAADEIAPEPVPIDPPPVTGKGRTSGLFTLPGAAPFQGPDGATVRIEADFPWGMYLFSAAPSGVGWDRLCSAPCDLRVDPAKTYRLDGPMLMASAPFKLEPRRPQTLYVNTANAGAYATGWVLAISGLAMMAPGAYIAHQGVEVTDKSTGERTRSTVPGWILLGVGAVMVIPGVALIVANTTTEVTDDRGRRVAVRLSATGSF